jgi:replicative DNA helicase
MLEVIEQSKNRKTVSTVETGLADVDRCIGGFRSGQLIILAARPSVGKSALAAQIAIHAAKEENNVLFVSLEMSSQETVARALAMECKELDMRSILNGDLASHEIHKAEQIANAYKKIPLRIEDRRGLNIDRLAMLVRSSAAKRKLGLVVIDYLGLIVGDRKKPRWESITEISNSLKTLAQTEQIPLLALCQLNRDSEGEVPKLSHLRDSGSIEQDADIVLLLHREKRNAVETELFIAKNRNGPIAKIQLEYEAKRFEFRTAFSDFGDFK